MNLFMNQLSIEGYYINRRNLSECEVIVTFGSANLVIVCTIKCLCNMAGHANLRTSEPRALSCDSCMQ